LAHAAADDKADAPAARQARLRDAYLALGRKRVAMSPQVDRPWIRNETILFF
jgi:hypothetical protein